MSGTVNAGLYTIRKRIQRANSLQPMNAVFVVYYNGGEALGERGNILEPYTAAPRT